MQAERYHFQLRDEEMQFSTIAFCLVCTWRGASPSPQVEEIKGVFYNGVSLSKRGEGITSSGDGGKLFSTI